MSKNDVLKRWEEHKKTLSRLSTVIFGVDTSKLNWREEKSFIETWKKRWELEVERERRNPKPTPILSKAEELEVRRLEAFQAKFEKIANGKPVKELSNDDLKEQLEVLRAMAGQSEVK